MLRQIPPVSDPNVLVSGASLDDAAVYRVTSDLALVQTVDIFTPVVDDPYDYGRIAAANSLSDIYAMGATPMFALSVLCFPRSALPMTIAEAILKGGVDVCRAAGIEILGGHSLDDSEPKFGLVVTGRVHPDKVITNAGARIGDVLVLTKPIGSGILTTALKRGHLAAGEIDGAVAVMAELNATAAQVMVSVGVHGATDVTGYGLLGHLREVIDASGVGARLDSERVPLIPGALTHLRAGVCPGGTKRNFDYLSDCVVFGDNVSEALQLLLADAQTSGGLLIAVAPQKADTLLSALHRAGVAAACPIGEITPTVGRIAVI